MHIPIRARITAAFAVVMLILLVAIGVLAYHSTSSALLDEIDSGLRFRASALAPSSIEGRTQSPDLRLQEPREAFQQVLDAGRVVHATSGFAAPLLTRHQLAGLSAPHFLERHVAGVEGPARLLAVPLGAARVLVVGTSMADRTDALRNLARVLLIGGPLAIAVACLAAWMVAGWALLPMDRMREEASAITLSGLDRRMPVPRTRDELQRLALTLNGMLDRLATSMTTERAFLERASHELRTPLAALRAEVDLALGRRRSAEELAAALRSVSDETDRLARLAEDLLVLARANEGRLPLRKERLPVRSTLESAAGLFAARARALEVDIVVSAPADADVVADPLRLRQALVNVLDNALRHTPPGGTVRVTGVLTGTDVRITVADTGPGFGDLAPAAGGLGLRIVRAVVASHDGSVQLSNGADGGACVELLLPVPDGPDG